MSTIFQQVMKEREKKGIQEKDVNNLKKDINSLQQKKLLGNTPYIKKSMDVTTKEPDTSTASKYTETKYNQMANQWIRLMGMERPDMKGAIQHEMGKSEYNLQGTAGKLEIFFPVKTSSFGYYPRNEKLLSFYNDSGSVKSFIIYEHNYNDSLSFGGQQPKEKCDISVASSIYPGMTFKLTSYLSKFLSATNPKLCGAFNTEIIETKTEALYKALLKWINLLAKRSLESEQKNFWIPNCNCAARYDGKIIPLTTFVPCTQLNYAINPNVPLK